MNIEIAAHLTPDVSASGEAHSVRESGRDGSAGGRQSQRARRYRPCDSGFWQTTVGEEFPTDAAISKLVVGRETMLSISLRDVSERKRTEDEERLLAEVGSILVAAGPHYEQLLTDVARVIVSKVSSTPTAGASGSKVKSVGALPRAR